MDSFYDIQDCWIVPCNAKKYDVVKAFHELHKVDWRQRIVKRIKPGDIVYIFVTHLDNETSKIMFKCKINKLNKEYPEIDDFKYCLDDSTNKSDRYMELELLEEYHDDYFSYPNLVKNGLRNKQGQHRAQTELVKYLSSYNK